jgi:hypothetical protein
MRLVKIQEFSLSTVVEQKCPVAYAEARLEEIAKALCASPCGEYLVPSDISLSKQNELYSYELSVPLFGGSSSITVNSQNITVLFNKGATRDHLQLMIGLTLAALRIAGIQQAKRSVLSFSMHAVFESPSEYDEHMRRFTSLSVDIKSGGHVLVAALPDLDGELRYMSEKSISYQQGVFIAASAIVRNGVTEDSYASLRGRFESLAGVDEIAIRRS